MMTWLKRTPALLSLLLAACGGDEHGQMGDDHAGHGAPDLPSSTPIEPVAFDAVYVVNGGDSTITVINAESDSVAAEIALENAPYPHHINLSPDSSRLALAIPGVDLSGGHGTHGAHGAEEVQSSVVVLDALTGKTLAAAKLGAMNHNAAFNASGTEIWTAQMTEPGSVLVLDAQTLETQATVAVGGGPSEVTFDRSGAVAFVANTGSDEVTAIDAATKEVLSTLSVGDEPVGAWPGRDGRMYVDNELGKSITVIDPTSLAVITTLELGFTPGYASVTEAGEMMVTDVDQGRLTFWDVETGQMLGAVETGAGAHAIALSADEATAYVTNQAASTVSVVDLAGRSVRATIPVGASPNGIAFRAR